MTIAIGIAAGAALAIVQYAITRALAASALKGRRGAARLGIALKLPLSLAVLALLAYISPLSAAFAAAGYTVASVLTAILSFKRRGE